MKVLVVGSGGREHALCDAIANSPLLTKLYCAPGNPGIAAVAECVGINALDISSLVGFAQDHAIDLVVPGPEAPLVAGITDAMEAAGGRLLRPDKAAARLGRQQDVREGGGGRCRHPDRAVGSGSRTPRPRASSSAGAGRRSWSRADGLAAGKGVTVAATEDEALAAIDAIMVRKLFGDTAVVIEECLQGEEVSLFALCDGEARAAAGVRPGPQARRRWGHRAPTPAVWALTRPCRIFLRSWSRRAWSLSSTRRCGRWHVAAPRSAACCSPG